MSRKFWLIKSEPSTYSLEDLKTAVNQTGFWDGIRNYQARNFMRDEMKKGDLALFYHSSCPNPGVVGVVEITKEAYSDDTAWDPKSDYFDPKASPKNPRWVGVDITYRTECKQFVSLKDLKATRELSDMKVVQKGQRLSIQPITEEEFRIVTKMGGIEVS